MLVSKSHPGNDVEFWRAHTDIYKTLIDVQITIINFQNWCLKWHIAINILKTSYMLLYDQRKNPNPPPILLIINGMSCNKVSSHKI